jgi:hypothetical protein
MATEQTTYYDFTELTGAQIASTLADAATDHSKIGAAGGTATLGTDGKVPDTQLPAGLVKTGTDGKVPSSVLPSDLATLDGDGKLAAGQIPPSAHSVADYKDDVDASGVTVADGTAGTTFEVVWVKNTDGTGRFAARSLPSVVGDSLKAKWTGWQQWCDINGKPLLSHIYRRRSDNALLVADSARTKLEAVAGGGQQGDSDGGKLALFADMWNNGWGDYGGYYPDTAPDPAKPFKGNDLWMTYEEALTVDRESSGSNYLRDYSHAQCTARTFYPISTHGGSYAQESKYAFVGCVNLEVIRFKGTIYTGLGQDCFYKCNKLKKIVGGGGLRPMHKDVFNLEAIEDFNAVISSDLNLSKASKVSLATLQYLVQHAVNGNTAITVTVHANVYAKLTGNTTNAAAGALTSGELAQWQAVVTAAAAKNISFASA